MPKTLTDKLLSWYKTNARNLPWRGVDDPYLTWVSEIMLQQTRVETVIPYFQRWIEHFPNLQSLAEAGQDEVLNAWEGLGYYSRARNLHRAARLLVEDHGGKLPRDPDALEEIPGIGPYTAGAIASMAFGVDAPAIDGNVKRVVSRLFNVDHEIQTSRARQAIRRHIEELLPTGRAGTFNQALMDLGAQICTPRSPACPDCPLAEDCEAHRLGIEEHRPVRQAKEEIPHHTVTAAVIHRDGSVLLAKRPSDALLGGMWEFPGGKQKEGESLCKALQREIEEELGARVRVGEKLGVFQHAYTHFRITLHAYHCSLQSAELQAQYHTDWAWVTPSALQGYPMGKVDRLIARQLQDGKPPPG